MSNPDPSHRPNLPADAEERLNEPPPTEIEEFLREPYGLTEHHVEAYTRNGFVRLEQVLVEEPLRYYRELIGMAVGHSFKDDDRSLVEKRVYERSFLQAHSLGLRYPALRRFVRSVRFATLARDLMRVEGVRLIVQPCLILLPGHTIHTCCRSLLQLEECFAQGQWRYMVQECREFILRLPLYSLPYPRSRLLHTPPALCPAYALVLRILLGCGPSLQ